MATAHNVAVVPAATHNVGIQAPRRQEELGGYSIPDQHLSPLAEVYARGRRALLLPGGAMALFFE